MLRRTRGADARGMSKSPSTTNTTAFYAQAALAYEKEDLVKAEEWLAIANRIFQDPNVLAPWQDTLVEYGYIKSFYGDDPAAAAE